MDNRRRVLFLFLDGVGMGEDDPTRNPFAATRMPQLERLLDGHRLVADGLQAIHKAVMVNNMHATLLAVDACMGVEGIPQSATGQAALLTGKNVPAWLGEHEGPKPTAPIIELIQRGTIFGTLKQQGKEASLLNAYPPRYFESIERGYRLPGVIALSAKMAGIQLKTQDDLSHGNALSADFSGEGWRTHLGFSTTPIINFDQAGKRLGELAQQTDLAVFEYWLTDLAGHHQDIEAARAILEALDVVIGSLVEAWDGEQSLVMITSDHGNMEDMSTRHHTHNDVPLLLIGSEATRGIFINELNGRLTCRSKPDLTDIGPAIQSFLR